MAIRQNYQEYNLETKSYDKHSRVFAEGAVIALGSRSSQIMSDVWDTEYYAEYWDEDSKSVKHAYLFYATESGAWECGSAAEVDATPEVWAKVENFYGEQFFDRHLENAEKEVNTIRKDSVVKVVAGRQNKGVEGKVVAVIERTYRTGAYNNRVEDKLGIATSDVMVEKIVGNRTYQNHRDVVWAWARNCELAVVPTFEEVPLVKLAAEQAKDKVDAMKKRQGEKIGQLGD